MQQKLSIVQIEVNTSLQTHILKKKKQDRLANFSCNRVYKERSCFIENALTKCLEQLTCKIRKKQNPVDYARPYVVQQNP
jgi:hypothetical protein